MSEKHRPDPKADGADTASTLDRRELLQASAGLGGAALLTGVSAPAVAQSTTPATTVRLADLAAEPFAEPPVWRSKNGILDKVLTVKYAASQIGADPVWLRSYEGLLTGPTLRVKAGDRIKILLKNDLPEEPGQPGHPDSEIKFNTTNFHTHGLHVHPTGNSDNVLLKIGPQSEVQLQIDIPDDHPPGTFWYHAHKHGSVSVQLASGMAGALIIEGNIDDVPEIKAAEEKLFVFQQIPYDKNGVVEDFVSLRKNFEDKFTTVNGIKKPRITMRPGEVQRWRFVDGGIFETLNIRLIETGKIDPADNQPLYQIAADGLTIGKKHRAKNDLLTLLPGYRADVLVQLEEGTYELRKEFNQEGIQGEAEDPQVLAEIVVSGDEKPMDLPGDESLAPLAPFDPIDPAEITGTRAVRFNMLGKFSDINGAEFDPARVDQTLNLGTAEDWILSSNQAGHPFHIHVNPFQVIEGDDDNNGLWKDTIFVTTKSDIRIRSRYTVFTGKFVLHCHNLLHEDQGMMQLVEIVAP